MLLFLRMLLLWSLFDAAAVARSPPCLTRAAALPLPPHLRGAMAVAAPVVAMPPVPPSAQVAPPAVTAPPPCTLLPSILSADPHGRSSALAAAAALALRRVSCSTHARTRRPALLGRCSCSVCCLYSLVVDVGGISVVLCCCYDFPSSPLQLESVFVDRVSFFLCACQVCLMGPACEVPSRWVFRPGSRHSIGELHPANLSSSCRDCRPRPTLARVPRDASKY